MICRYVAVVAGAAWLFLLPIRSIADSSAVQVSEAWVRETAPGQSIGAAYMHIRSRDDLTLIGVTSTASRAAELHQMSMKGDLMQMREVRTIKVAPGTGAALQPGGTHIMLVDIKRPLKAGDAVALRLTFRRADGSTFVLRVTAPVRPITAETRHGH